MAADTYVGPPPHELAKEFIAGWQMFRKTIEEGIKSPNLPDEVDAQFLNLKAQLIARSRILELATGGGWGLHPKLKGLLNTCESLDYIRQESQIIHDSILNQWHDQYIQASKLVAVFEEKFQEEQV